MHLLALTLVHYLSPTHRYTLRINTNTYTYLYPSTQTNTHIHHTTHSYTPLTQAYTHSTTHTNPTSLPTHPPTNTPTHTPTCPPTHQHTHPHSHPTTHIYSTSLLPPLTQAHFPLPLPLQTHFYTLSSPHAHHPSGTPKPSILLHQSLKRL